MITGLIPQAQLFDAEALTLLTAERATLNAPRLPLAANIRDNPELPANTWLHCPCRPGWRRGNGLEGQTQRGVRGYARRASVRGPAQRMSQTQPEPVRHVELQSGVQVQLGTRRCQRRPVALRR